METKATMKLAVLKAPYLVVASLARQHPPMIMTSGRSSSTHLMASSSSSSTPSPAFLPVFPVWIRLKGYATYECRQHVTSQVADSISTSGGFLSRFNLLSDMITVMTLEDVQPNRLAAFQQELQQIEGFRLDTESIHLLEQCQALVQLEERDRTTTLPSAVSCNLQISWLNAPGTLRQEIPAVDG